MKIISLLSRSGTTSSSYRRANRNDWSSWLATATGRKTRATKASVKRKLCNDIRRTRHRMRRISIRLWSWRKWLPRRLVITNTMPRCVNKVVICRFRANRWQRWFRIDSPWLFMNMCVSLDESDACFRRIDRNIRFTLKSLLKRHQLPLVNIEDSSMAMNLSKFLQERIAWFEDDVIPFFVEHPDSVYLRHLNHGFDRMILHAVCQYLNLISKSNRTRRTSYLQIMARFSSLGSTRDGERYTQVENRRAQFLPPKKLLSHYMKQLDDMAHSDS